MQPDIVPPLDRVDACRLCGSQLSIRYRDVVIDDPDRCRRRRLLWECESCHAYWSLLPPEIASGDYYPAKPAEDHARLEQSSQRFRRVRSAVEAALNRSSYRIVDVGCAAGAHLDVYGPEVAKFGIEPSRSALTGLEQRGIRWLGPDITSAIGESFDAVTCLDVVEHLESPRPFFDGLHELLAPGGVLAIVTGNIDSLSARWAGQRWLYYALPEHCSFFSKHALTRYWVDEQRYEPVLASWIANQDIDALYVATFVKGVAREAALKLIPQRQLHARGIGGRSYFPFFCDSNMLLTLRKPLAD